MNCSQMAGLLRLLYLFFLFSMSSKVICQGNGCIGLLQVYGDGIDCSCQSANGHQLAEVSFPNSGLIPSHQEDEHAIQQQLMRSRQESSFAYSRTRILLTGSRQHYYSSRLPPPLYPTAPSHEVSPPPVPIVKPHKKSHHKYHQPVTSPSPSPSRGKIRERFPSPAVGHKAVPPSYQQRPSTVARPPYISSPHGRYSRAPGYMPSGHRIAPSPSYSASGPTVPAEAPLIPVDVQPKPSSEPPPIEDCGATLCLPPLTKTAFLSPCGCVRPMEVEIQLAVPLYSLFPFVSVLAANIADGTVLNPNQVEIIAAHADSQHPDFSIVVVNLVPLDPEFDNLTAFLIFSKFWNHEVALNSTLFGNYSVIYVHYPGLPTSPPSQADIGWIGGSGQKSNEDPLGVNVNQKSHKLSVFMIVIIALSSAMALVACLGGLWFLSRRNFLENVTAPLNEVGKLSSRTKRSGGRSLLFSDLGSSSSLSFTSSMATYASNARTFTLAELNKATNKFTPENVIGEGGFGRVYCGILDDGMKVAVKVLTRDHGGKEFISEVEMLSRLHHRNLVKLIGICKEEHIRCLVYELIPNGSVESHLHGVDKHSSPLDWDTRMKIALGAARGLAYLHEDSNPRVIHRDFKASNILLESDFTPKVADFGLAKVVQNEGREYLSTQVMGTFGYVAPEYAMTGHLLVKSDVYSYGVVLLELLSGRPPVDMQKPPGQANLVTWARPLLTSKEGLEILVDPALGRSFSFENLVRVAAIASMCVHPEVAHRPFMGEVVQALKLVYNDTEVQNGTDSSNGSQEDGSFTESVDVEQLWLEQKARYALDCSSFVSVDYDSGPSHVADVASRRPLSASSLFPESLKFMRQKSRNFRRHSMSGPLRSSATRVDGHKFLGISRQGSMSERVALSKHFGIRLSGGFF
ncbi:hypothetical protein KP509_34G031700 [Ceratopteris richardii]|uniref:Protein kinase domain-containing protein n=1 Tax=Ceratopteris richardii TaxID=49495 RepID=A0A8T2QK24_CERRI|nr:hypothetical protein KP509_34G031700 [Ceratopteris richardii]